MLSWIAACLSIVGIFLNAKKIIWCWPVWIASNILWIYLSLKSSNWPQLLLWIAFTIGNTYGWICWKKIIS